jgi:hypothetical protein
MRADHTNHTTPLMSDGSLIVVGLSFAPTFPDELSVDRYDPKTNTWAALAPLIRNRNFYTTTLLRDGSLLVVGGDDGDSYASVERYKVQRYAWQPIASRRATASAASRLISAGRSLPSRPMPTAPMRSRALPMAAILSA